MRTTPQSIIAALSFERLTQKYGPIFSTSKRLTLQSQIAVYTRLLDVGSQR